MKTLKRKILLSLSLPIDFFQQSEGFAYLPYNFLYFLLADYHRGSIRDALNQLAESGEVDKIVRDQQSLRGQGSFRDQQSLRGQRPSRNQRPFFRLTGLGRQQLLGFFPIALGQKRVWDRRWRLVIINHQRPPSQSQWRQALKKIKSLGFQQLTRGVYLTPLPVSQILQDFFLERNLLGKLFFIESRRFLAGDDQKLAKNVWKWEEIEKNYQSLIRESRRVLKKLKIDKELEDEAKKEIAELFDNYFFLLAADPGLPKRVLPTDWPGDLARESFLAIFQFLKDEKLVDVF